MIESKNLENVEYKEFQKSFSEILNKMPTGFIKDYNFIYFPGYQLPWYETNITIQAGEKITVFSKGKIFIFKQFNIWLEPHLQLWFRIGQEGIIFNGPQNTFTFTAESTGKLFLANYLQDWADKKGNTNKVDEKNYKRFKIKDGISILIIRWNQEPINALKKLLSIGDFEDLIKSEVNRLSNPIYPPEGWNYLWSVGDSDIFQEIIDENQKKIIRCQTKGNQAILQKDVILPLQPDTKLRWAWKINVLPSAKAEDHLFYHDYLSIAVEFDNGQDITYHWSSELSVETVYRCPIPTWNKRETHLVVRSGKNGLGQWINEERNVFEDYKKAIGGTPNNIIKVWLIANTIFQRPEGKCDFADIELISSDFSIKIL